MVDDFDLKQSGAASGSPQKRGWFYRILRSASGQQPTTLSTSHTHEIRHKRSVSDLAHHLVHQRREPTKTIDIQSMVRLSGKSILYLPAEHAPSALALPTCLHATAHYLAQHAATRGIFRIPGSARIVNNLFDYYCFMEKGGLNIAGTVRCSNLPMHIQASVHDVASTFKRLLSVLPGGILGSLATFDALVAIHSQLHGDPEFPRTKHTKVRARLIALAIATIESHFRRELICAVFGLLSLIGRVAEVAPREDEGGKPLPTGDLMGYTALGIVFGPLLLGDMLDNYSMKLACPGSGLLLFPLTSPKHCRKSKTADPKSAEPLIVNKILIANGISEMLISNWRDIVRQMKSIGMQREKEPPSLSSTRTDSLQHSASESFFIKKPRDWDRERETQSHKPELEGDQSNRQESPELGPPTLGMRRQRPVKRKNSFNRLGHRPSVSILSPTVEEAGVEDENCRTGPLPSQAHIAPKGPRPQLRHHTAGLDVSSHNHFSTGSPCQKVRALGLTASQPNHELGLSDQYENLASNSRKRRETTRWESPRVSLDDVPPRTSSKQRQDADLTNREQRQRDSSSDIEPVETGKPNASFVERRKALRAKAHGKDGPKIQDRTSLTPEYEPQRPRRSRTFSFGQQDEELVGLTVPPSQPQRTLPDTTVPAFPESLMFPYPNVHQSPPPLAPNNQHTSRSENVGFFTIPSQEQSTARPTGHDQPHESTSAESCRRKTTQFDVTPQDFYAEMRVPPSLSAYQNQLPLGTRADA